MEGEADKLIGSHICYRIYQQSTSRGLVKINKKTNNNTKKPRGTMEYYNMI